MPPTIKLAEYLLIRLQQMGVQSIHGVPGDYNLLLMDEVEDFGLHWVGNCNELNAGYAADGYARIKGLGALITTFGVGELSAINAIAGAFAERVPVVHIVGTPSRDQQEAGAYIHHTLNDGNFRHFAQMYEHVTCAQANLLDPSVCPELIDLTLLQCLKQSQPVYIELPTDMVSAMIDSSLLKSSIAQFEPLSDGLCEESAALSAVLESVYASKRPAILVDGESWSYGILDELDTLCTRTQWPTWTSVFGKSLIDESLPNVHGIWKGPNWANREHRDYMDSTDLILCFGPHFSSTNTYDYSTIPDYGKSIVFAASEVNVKGSKLRNMPVKAFVRKLLHTLDPSKIAQPPQLFSERLSRSNDKLRPDEALTQKDFFLEFNKSLRPGDVILAETGTAGHGCRDFKLPPNTRLFKPATWLSIGYMLPATQGAALAQRDSSKTPPHSQRTILLTGDGSFQMTAQELGTIAREELNVVIVLINNSGYTIERCLHGWDRRYNSIASWRYLQGPSFFGANVSGDGYVAELHRAETWSELWDALESIQRSDRRALRMIEVVMAPCDAPVTLLRSLQEQKNGIS